MRPFALLASQYATTDEDLDWLLCAGECWLVEEGGEAVAGWAQQWQGERLHILVYGGRAGIDLVRVLAACIEAQAPRVASFQTRRRGLMKKAEALGYSVAGRLANGVIMRKDF